MVRNFIIKWWKNIFGFELTQILFEFELTIIFVWIWSEIFFYDEFVWEDLKFYFEKKNKLNLYLVKEFKNYKMPTNKIYYSLHFKIIL